MKFYIASKLENAEKVKEVRDYLTDAGHTCTYDWTAHGSVQADGDERIAEVAKLEVAGVSTADFVVVLLPGGRGTHTELGIAVGLKKPTLVFGDTEGAFLGADGYTCAFYLAPNVLRKWGDWDDLPGHLRNLIRIAGQKCEHGYGTEPLPPGRIGHRCIECKEVFSEKGSPWQRYMHLIHLWLLSDHPPDELANRLDEAWCSLEKEAAHEVSRLLENEFSLRTKR